MKGRLFASTLLLCSSISWGENAEAEWLASFQGYGVDDQSLCGPRIPNGATVLKDASLLVGEWECILDNISYTTFNGLSGYVDESHHAIKKAYRFCSDGTFTSVEALGIDTLDAGHGDVITGTWRMEGETLVLVRTMLTTNLGFSYRNRVVKRLRVLVFNREEIGFQYVTPQDLLNSTLAEQKARERPDGINMPNINPATQYTAGYDKDGFEVVRRFYLEPTLVWSGRIDLTSPSHYKRVASSLLPKPVPVPTVPRTNHAVAPSPSGTLQPQTPEIGPHYEYVVERGQTLALIAKGFGTTIPKILAANPGLRHSGLRVGQKLIIPAEDAPVPPSATVAQQQPTKPPYALERLEWVEGKDFALVFEVKLRDECSIKSFFGIQREFENEVRQFYCVRYPRVDTNSLVFDFKPALKNGRITGQVEVLTITPVSLTYDSNTRKGMLAVRYNANQFVEAREWIRRNIETLARDKNIALTTGEIPPAAKFYLGNEELKDGNVLEIEFRTE